MASQQEFNLPLLRSGSREKQSSTHFFVVLGKILPRSYETAMEDIQRLVHSHTLATIILFLRALATSGTCILSHCLMIRGEIHVTEPLPSSDREIDRIDMRN